MPAIDRRSLLAGAAATSAFAATASFAQPDQVQAEPDLSGKAILITGCSSGFGRLMAEDYARKGAKVFATMRNLPRPEADELRQLAESEKLDLHLIEIDVTSDEQVAAGVAEAERINGGPLDVLINNAGVGYAGPIELQDMIATQLIFDTNVYGPHRMARAALPGMRKAKSGMIFNISSQLGRVIVPSSGHYSPTKFALEAMSEAMAYELAPHGVEVCVIQPGGYPTKVWVNRNQLASELKDRLSEEQAAAYPELVDRMGKEDGTRRTADPMDVPRAIAEIIAMPPGTRPLRRAVHPGAKPQEAINRVSAETQVAMLGNSPFGPWVKAVHNV
ncbi:SDR family oxidoreductase [Altererythrobacter sp. BO-6]|uniref:SDR family oxidoreductase n=1 Tax=Altererythrobacter sp. BO-6 TaxID=2604537 RepID=UPI0013E1204A|nr:SDR family oxidoreductase [Altererythrobacter sp. BO-6]QIG53010.1 SDR family oxidoreductase [Altererythrobacter sp. BO-6]